LKIELGFENAFTVDCKGRSGGLILLWKTEIEVEIQNYSRHHINAVIQCSPAEPKWKFIGFYGHPDVNRWCEAWSLLRYLAKFSPVPWLCIGDFNAITSSMEKSSSSARSHSQNFDFQRALADCQLVDLGFHGPKYTWSNGRGGAALTRKRLDRAVANVEWSSYFNASEVNVLARLASDHNPLLLSCSSNREVKWKKHRSFKYEAGWAKQKEHGELIRRAWFSRSLQGDHWQTGNLKRCQKSLQHWVRKEGMLSEVKIREVFQKLRDVQMNESEPNSVEESNLQSELHFLLEQEEIKWKQRAREEWLKSGDGNTKFFHACANQKSRRKQILRIVDKHGRTVVLKVILRMLLTGISKTFFLLGPTWKWIVVWWLLKGRSLLK